MGWARPGARQAYVLVLLVGYGLVLYWNLPGHLSVDSVLALHEGRFRVRETWNPAIFGWLLGRADAVRPGTAVAVGVSAAILFGGWIALAALRPGRASWLAPLAALGAIALPQALIYPGIVWKDVWFAETAVGGFVLLAFALRSRSFPARWAWLLSAGLLLAVAGLLRQNGLILAAPAALAIACAGGPWPRRRDLGSAVAWLVVVGLMSLFLSAYAKPQGEGRPDDAGGKGVRILQVYDIVGAAAREPLPLGELDRFDPTLDDEVRARAGRTYSAERVDTLMADPELGRRLAVAPSDVIAAQWVEIVSEHPRLYLQTRVEVFRWVFLTPLLNRCLPVHLGVEGPREALADLKIPPRRSLSDTRLYNYITWFLDTPAYSHLAYGVVALVVGGLLLFRREPADLAMSALMAGALAFAASFFAISLACDYRYLYLLDVAALSGLLYLALYPDLRRR